MSVKTVNEKFTAGMRMLWPLRRLRDYGLSIKDLLKVYFMTVRSRLEFAINGFYTLLSKGQIEKLERVQRRATKIILNDYEMNYRQRLFVCEITSLSDRWQAQFGKFALSLEKNGNLESWFPKLEQNATVDLRTKRKYKVPNYRTERYKRNPKNKILEYLNEYYK